MQAFARVQTTGTSRREFIARCAACAACAACPGVARSQTADSSKPKIRLVFTHITPEKPTWPYQGYDYEDRKKELAARLREGCPGVEFTLPATVQNRQQAVKLLEGDAEVDGYLIYMIGLWSGGGALAIAEAGKPTLFVDDLYGGSGEFLMAYSAARRKGLKVAPVSSSRFSDVTDAVKAFEATHRLRHAVILDVLDGEPGGTAEAIKDVFGCEVRKITSAELLAAYKKADRPEAHQAAGGWMKAAKKIVEPTRDEIGRSGMMYVAMQDLMKQYKSDALTIDCLSLFYGGKLPSYPCLGLMQLNNDGQVGACEADLDSAISMLAISYLTGRPGFISDPVIDTSKNQIIYAHCVSPTKVYGPKGISVPYHIRSHSEDRKGAAVRALLPVNELTTTLKFSPTRKEMVFHQARAVANIDDDKACRTKLAAEVRDVDKILGEWDRWGWHRVTFYGDLKRPAYNLAAMLGIKVIEEG
ncbi:MAG TPA: hypothetical protein VN428_10855 [Bryobacteraceae bacterium]|nr:hypothetical protein [Bryobacteraceae bacterium]